MFGKLRGGEHGVWLRQHRWRSHRHSPKGLTPKIITTLIIFNSNKTLLSSMTSPMHKKTHHPHYPQHHLNLPKLAHVLMEDPTTTQVRIVSFTGSTVVGQKIAALTAPAMKKVFIATTSPSTYSQYHNHCFLNLKSIVYRYLWS